jgi:hypothetical protein
MATGGIKGLGAGRNAALKPFRKQGSTMRPILTLVTRRIVVWNGSVREQRRFLVRRRGSNRDSKDENPS